MGGPPWGPHAWSQRVLPLHQHHGPVSVGGLHALGGSPRVSPSCAMGLVGPLQHPTTGLVLG